MNSGVKKIKSFTDLNAWKEAHKLVLMIYEITKDFPKEEMFGLTSQIRRAVVSVVSNIAEGFSRQSYKEKTQFYFIAQGSLTEIQSQLLIAKDLKYVNKQSFTDIANQTIIAHKLLYGLIKKSKNISAHNSQFTIHNSSKSGFTLIELVVAIAVLIIMVVAISAFFIVLYKEQGSDIARIERTDAAGRTIETMSSEIRKMNRAESGVFPLETVQEQTLVFYSDIDNDGLTEKIEYSLNGSDETILERKLTEPGDDLDYSGEEVTTVVVSGIKNGTDPLFKYYDKDYTGTEGSLSGEINVTDVRIIEIILDINPSDKYLSSSLRAETKVHPRNLKNFD